MAEPYQEKVLSVHHWSDKLFTFRTTRDPGLRFRNGEFVMLGLAQGERPLMRAYSMTSANYEEYLEFYSIKVPDGALTSKLALIKPGDPILISRKPSGSLLWDRLRPGAERLYLLATGTGLAPFLSIIKDPEVYDNFERVILVHGCRYINELSYQTLITEELRQNEYFGDSVRDQLLYYPAVTREPYRNYGRITRLLETGKIMRDLNLPPLSPDTDRCMLCGSPAMLESLGALLQQFGLTETRKSDLGEYLVERAFVEK